MLCWAKKAAAGYGLQKLQVCPGKGAGGNTGKYRKYKEIQDLADLGRNWVLALCFLCHVFRVPPVLTQKAKREEGRCVEGRERLL